MILDNTHFKVTIEKNAIQQLGSVLKLFQELHMSSDHYVYFKSTDATKVLIGTCHKNAAVKDTAPLEAMIPLIIHKMTLLPACEDGYVDGDGSNYAAYTINATYHGIEITRSYVYAGK